MNGAVGIVSGLRQEVAEKKAELHDLQRQLLAAESQQRRADLHILADAQGSAAGPHGMVVEQGQQPDSAATRGFPTSRSEIRGDRARPVNVSGMAVLEASSFESFQVPRSRQELPAPGSVTGETGKGPALVKLFE